ESLNQVGGIFCFLSNTRFEEFFNKGPYFAQIDESDCFGENRGGDDQSAAASQAVEDTNVIVDAKREEGKAGEVTLWIDDSEKDGPFMAHLKIASGPTEVNPIGVVQMAWGTDDNGGYITTRQQDGQVQVNFAEIGGGKESDGTYSYKRQMGAL